MFSNLSDDPLPSCPMGFGKKIIISVGAIIFLLAGLSAANVLADDDTASTNYGKSVDVSLIDPMNLAGVGLIKSNNYHQDKNICTGDDEVERSDSELDELVRGYPIADMIPFIAQKDPRVAGFLVAIAKKESDWGKFSPKKNGQECFNFWGYRGPENTTDSGYSCFSSPEDAVNIVGSRIERLVNSHIDTPSKMVVWKCGSDCAAAGGDGAARKWIGDVGALYAKINS